MNIIKHVKNLLDLEKIFVSFAIVGLILTILQGILFFGGMYILMKQQLEQEAYLEIINP